LVVFCTVGDCIDFWLGKRLQYRLKDALEPWWLRFEYVRWRTFGRDEANSAIDNQIFGSRLLSLRRLAVCGLNKPEIGNQGTYGMRGGW
jgi:hypothetical protein